MPRKRAKKPGHAPAAREPAAAKSTSAAAAAPAMMPVAAFFRSHAHWLPATLVAGAYFILVALFYPYHDVWEFDVDEGNRVIIAKLMQQGHALYADIWNDQPPLYSYLTLWWCNLFGWTVNSARLLVLFTTAVMLWTMYDLLRVSWGHGAGLAAVAILSVGHMFMRLSVCAMIGLPAIAFAVMCAWALIRWSYDRRPVWLIAAGVLMGCSLLTKAFVGYALPLFGGWILCLAWAGLAERKQWYRALWPPVLWTLALLAFVALTVLLTVPWSELHQLYHSKVAGTHVYASSARRTLNHIVRADDRLWKLALVGLLLIAVQRRWRLLLAPAWAALGYVVLFNHAPIWSHYVLLLSVPGAMAAGVAAGDVFCGGWRPQLSPVYISRMLLRVIAVALAISLVVKVAQGHKNIVNTGGHGWDEQHRLVVDLLKTYADRADTLMTDRQMYAFRSGLNLPPSMAVTSLMRIETDPNFVATFTETTRSHDAGLIAFGRSLEPMADRIVAALDGRYYPLYIAEGQSRIYVRRDILGDPVAAIERALARHPEVGAGYTNLGLHLAKRGEQNRALRALADGLKRSPGDPSARMTMADALMATGRHDDAWDLLQDGMRLGLAAITMSYPRHYAWRRATAPDAEHRNGAEAAFVIEQVIKAVPTPLPLDRSIEAAALAAQGRFDEAARTAQTALARAAATGDAPLTQRLREQLERYQRGELLLVPAPFPAAP